MYDPRLDGKQFTHFIIDLVPPERCVARMTDRIRELAPLHGLGAESPMFDEREIAQGGEPRTGILVVDEAAQAAHR